MEQLSQLEAADDDEIPPGKYMGRRNAETMPSYGLGGMYNLSKDKERL